MKNTGKIFDGLLVLEYQSGSKKALSVLVNKHHKRLCKHSYWYTHNIEASKDIVQDSWSVIINKLGNLKDPNNFGSWATKIVIRKSIDFLSKERKTKQVFERLKSESATSTKELNIESEIKKLIEAIRVLPVNQQMVLKLFYIEEYSLKEISDILEISIGTVKSRLFHAREKLKTILKK